MKTIFHKKHLSRANDDVRLSPLCKDKKDSNQELIQNPSQEYIMQKKKTIPQQPVLVQKGKSGPKTSRKKALDTTGRHASVHSEKQVK